MKSELIQRTAILAVLSILASGGLLLGQVYNPATEVWEYEGSDVPMYFVVKSFLDYVREANSLGLVVFEENVLKPLGIEGGNTEAKASLVAAAKEAAEILAPFDLTPYRDDPEEFERVQIEHLRKVVAGIERVFRKLLSDLEKHGVASSAVLDFLEKEMRPGVSVGVTLAPGPAIDVIKKFNFNR